MLAKVVEGKIEILQQVFFETDSATIKDESAPVLKAIAEVVQSLDGKRVRIEGHTDDRGTDQYNLDLSKRRARAVAQWLITNGGIPTTQLETTGYGKSRPLVSGPDADPSQNRRVELIIIDK
jgi:outer membrane protein OmpA-like peptidoglycan-associated protein